jgi:ketosteroid isomerase-like protein
VKYGDRPQLRAATRSGYNSGRSAGTVARLIMTDEAQNVIVLKDAYDRWAESKGDSADHWTAIFADNIKFGSLAQGSYGAAYLTEYQSRDQLAQYFAGIKRDWEMIEYVTENFVAQGDRVVMLGRCSWRNRHTGKVVATPKADSWRFADGKAIEFYEYYDTAQLRDATV